MWFERRLSGHASFVAEILEALLLAFIALIFMAELINLLGGA
jgi:hypothetical protein